MSYRLGCRSSVTGRPPTTRAQAYILWRINQELPANVRSRYWPIPTLDEAVEPGEAGPNALRLNRLHREAINEVRSELLSRIDRHLTGVRRGQALEGIEVGERPTRKPYRPEPHLVPSSGSWNGLPGVYWNDCPVPFGNLRGEPSRDDLLDPEAHGTLRIVPVSEKDLRRLYARIAGSDRAIDEAAIAENVVRWYSRGDGNTNTAERLLRRYAEDVRDMYRAASPD